MNKTKKKKHPVNLLNKTIPKQDDFELWFDKMACELNRQKSKYNNLIILDNTEGLIHRGIIDKLSDIKR